MWFPGKGRFDRMVDSKEAHRRFNEEIRPELEKGDLPAMIIAGLVTFLPVVLAIVALMVLFMWWVG